MEKKSNIFHSKMAENGFWMVLLQGFNTIIPLLTLPYITRILSTAAYGEFSIALNWIGYFQVIVEYGFGLTGARRVATHKRKEELDVLHSDIICARLVLLILCVAFFTVLVLLMHIERTQVICMVVLFLMILAIVFQQNWFFQGVAEMKNITIINVISRSISVALIILLVKSPNDLYLYCFLYISNFIISSIFGCLVVRFKYGVKFSFPHFNEIINELIDGWPLFVSSAMTKIFGNIGITILALISSKDVVGIYSAISKIPYVLSSLFSAIAQALYPYICNSFENSYKNGLKNVRKYGIPVFFFFVIGGVLIVAANNFIVRIAFGADYVGSSTLLIPFVIWVLFGIANNFLGIQTLVASGHQKEYSTAFTISVAVMLGLMFLLGHFFGEYGIAYASMISEMILSVMLILFIKKVMKKEIVNDK